MIHFVILLLVLLGAACYYMTREERDRAFRVVIAVLRDVWDAITLQGLQCDEFLDALRARTGRVLVTPLLIVLSVATTFIFWGGTHAEGWHRFIAIFAQPRVLDLFVSTVCVLQVGLILERLVGRMVFTTIYVGTGAAAGIICLVLYPEGVNVGASGSVLGIYGLLLVTSIWGVMRRSDLTIPLNVAKRLAPVAAVFIIYHLVMADFGNVALATAFFGGVIGGIVVAREVNDRTPAMRPIGAAMAALLVVATVYSLVMVRPPVSATTDVRPEIERVIAVEHRTANLYDEAVGRFRKGRISATALAEVIEQTIVPELHTLSARLNALQGVAPQDRSLVTTGEEFLKLRDESWQMRAAALLKGDMVALRRADSKEQASREAFERLKTRAIPLIS